MKRFTFTFSIYVLSSIAIIILLAFYLKHPQQLPIHLKNTSADPMIYMNEQMLHQIKQYAPIRHLLFFTSYLWHWGVLLLLIMSGISTKLYTKIKKTVTKTWLAFIVYVISVQLIVTLGSFPIRFVSYQLARTYNISVQPLMSWFRDYFISFSIQCITLLIVFAALFWLMNRVKQWVIVLWLLSIPFILLVMYIQPVWIDPLFDKFQRLSDPILEQKIIELADEAHIPADRVYEVNVSSKTNALNAYVNGIGNNLRIVLWDTTLQRLDTEEILFIMAHEMGHFVQHHLEWSALGMIGSSFFLIWIGAYLYRRALKYLRIDWNLDAWIASIPLILLIFSMLSFWMLPVSNAVSRQAETSADEYAISITDDPGAAITMYQKLAQSSLSDTYPKWLIKVFRSTHPSIVERIERIEKSRMQE